jgi:AcrR family transcriptional regulator
LENARERHREGVDPIFNGESDILGGGTMTEGATVASVADAALRRRLNKTVERASGDLRTILDSTLRVLARSGWDDFKVATVLREAGLSTRAMYQVFSGKSELVLALYEREIQSFARRLNDELRSADTLVERIVIWITLYTGMGYDHRIAPRARYFARAGEFLVRDFPTTVSSIRGLVVEPLRAVIEEGVGTGQFSDARPNEDATAIWLMTSSLIRDPLSGGSLTSERERAIELTLDFALRALVKPT